MLITDIPAILQILKSLGKLSERLGMFLCRNKIAALNLEIKTLKAELKTIKSNTPEHHSKCEAQYPNHTPPETLSRYHRITIAGFPVYALRPEYVTPGDRTHLICPSCFDRGIKSELICNTRNDLVAINKYKRGKHLKCIAGECRFHIIVPVELYDKAVKPI